MPRRAQRRMTREERETLEMIVAAFDVMLGGNDALTWWLGGYYDCGGSEGEQKGKEAVATAKAALERERIRHV